MRFLNVGILSLLLLGACASEGPPAGPTSVFLTIRNSAPVVPDELRLTVTGSTGTRIVEGARLPETGSLVPVGGTVLGTVTVYVEAGGDDVELDLEVVGHVQSTIMSRGLATARVVGGHQVSAQVTLQAFVVEADAGVNDAAGDAGTDGADDAGPVVDAGGESRADVGEDLAVAADGNQDQWAGDRPADAGADTMAGGDTAADVVPEVGGRDGDAPDVATLDGGTTDAAAGLPLFLRLTFDEPSGAVANDSSGNRRDGTLMGGVTRVAAGKLGGAVHFDGVSGTFIALPTNLLDAVRDVTIATWVRVGMVRNNQKVFDFGAGDGARTMYLTTHTNGGVVRFAITTSGIAGEQRIEGPAGLPVGVWTHVAVVLGPAGGTLYVDGAAVATNAAVTLRPMGLAMTPNVWLGRSQMASTPILDGDLDDFRIYDRALTAAEVAAVRGATQ